MNECVISARHRLAHINYILTANSIKVNDVNVCKHVRCVANSRRYIVFNLYCITVISIWRVCEYGTIERHSRIFAHPLQVGVVYLNTCVPKYHICWQSDYSNVYVQLKIGTNSSAAWGPLISARAHTCQWHQRCVITKIEDNRRKNPPDLTRWYGRDTSAPMTRNKVRKIQHTQKIHTHTHKAWTWTWTIHMCIVCRMLEIVFECCSSFGIMQHKDRRKYKNKSNRMSLPFGLDAQTRYVHDWWINE